MLKAIKNSIECPVILLNQDNVLKLQQVPDLDFYLCEKNSFLKCAFGIFYKSVLE